MTWTDRITRPPALPSHVERVLIARQHSLFATQAQATGESGRVGNFGKWVEDGWQAFAPDASEEQRGRLQPEFTAWLEMQASRWRAIR